MSEWRLLQLDFYNILAPATTTNVPKREVNAEVLPRIEPDSDAFNDLKIRALMHGFDEAMDPNDVAHLLEEEPIPLRSMRIPIRGNVSAGWAPNGYGKTYIFDYLERQTKRFNDDVKLPPIIQQARQMNEDPLVDAARHLAETYSTHDYYLQNDEHYFTKEHWDGLFGSAEEDLDIDGMNAFFSNPPPEYVSIAASFDDLKLKLAQKYGDGTLSGLDQQGEPMLYPTIQKLEEFNEKNYWEKEVIRLNLGNLGSELVPYHCRGCVIENRNTRKRFHVLEFPRVSAYDDVERQTCSEIYYQEISADSEKRDGILSGWAYSNSNHWSVLEYDWEENEYGGESAISECELGSHLDVQLWMDSIDAEYVEIPSLASKERFSEFLTIQSSQLTNQYAFESSRYQSLASNLKPLAPVKEPRGLVQEIGLLSVIQEIVDEIDLICNPNFNGIDEFGYEKRISTIHALISDLEYTKDDWANFGEALCDDDMEIWGREVKDILGYLFDIRFLYKEHHEIRQAIYARLLKLFSEIPTQPFPGLECLKAFGLVFDWMEARIKYLDEDKDGPQFVSDVLNPLISAEQHLIGQRDEFVRTLGEYLDLRRVEGDTDFLDHFAEAAGDNLSLSAKRIRQALQMSSTFPINLNERDDLENARSLREVIELTFQSLGIDFSFNDGVGVYPGKNHYIIAKNLNKCLSPSDHAHNPWGVEASIQFQSGEESGDLESASIQFHPVLTGRMNTLRPEHLSFGMRSETVLQLKLSEILSSRRSRLGHGPDLLIIDEPEIGRSEYWTNMLIHRLRRLEQQFGDDGQQSVLIVSHRGDVLENCTQSGDYTIMHRTPQSER